MYGHQAEIKRIQSRLQKIGKAHPYHNVESVIDGRSKVDKVASNPEADSPSVPSPEHLSKRSQQPKLSQQPQVGKQYRSSLAATKAKGSAELPDQGSGNSHEQDMRDLVRSPDLSEESFRSTHDRYHSVAGKQALREMGKAVDQGKQLPHTFGDVWNTPSSQTSVASRSDVPHPDGETVMRESFMGPNAKENAHVVAHALRHRQTGFGSRQRQEEGSFTGDSAYSSYANDELAFAPIPRFTVTQGAIWLFGAVIVRMGIDRLLATFPHLWPIMAAMVLTPVAISLYQTAVTPQSTVHSGRRLLVIMMGLLIGGQL